MRIVFIYSFCFCVAFHIWFSFMYALLLSNKWILYLFLWSNKNTNYFLTSGFVFLSLFTFIWNFVIGNCKCWCTFSVRNEYDLLFRIWFFCLPPLHRTLAMSSLIHEQLNFIGIYENGVTTSLTNTWKNKLTNNKAMNWTNDGQSDTLQCDDFSLNRFRNGATSTLPFFFSFYWTITVTFTH